MTRRSVFVCNLCHSSVEIGGGVLDEPEGWAEFAYRIRGNPDKP